MGKVRRKAKNQNKNLIKDSKQFKRIFNKYAKSETTALYKKLLEEARRGGYLEQFKRMTEWRDPETDDAIIHKWFTKLMPTEEYMDEFAEWVPGAGWNDYESNDTWRNKDFDES